MTYPIPRHDEEHRAINETLGLLRPKLHRYCARMAGSAIDGEDLMQDVLVKALEVLPGKQIDSVENWLFHVAHNITIDFLRRRRRRYDLQSEEDPDMIADSAASEADPFVAAAGLRTFMYLPAAQRACTILKDILDYSLQEIADITESSIPAVKSSLHRGRNRIHELAGAPNESVPRLSEEELSRLARYVRHFNDRDFDAVRDMLADDVRLELVAKTRMAGRRQVSRYFHNYSGVDDWRLAPGLVDGRPALLVFDPNDAAVTPSYFVLLEWGKDQIRSIRDFRHAKYVADSAEMIPFGPSGGSS
ncbi:sigma-70 family RNA polymerase sigma factor [Rhodanobacter ginsengisoli]|uniref:Sigma-70 family RNA polymerase sigma factor n=1 Tax=Rhodanobacter ginsengisoli TaxID=418646 RepID=A0ABW0QII5_9GAMM